MASRRLALLQGGSCRLVTAFVLSRDLLLLEVFTLLCSLLPYITLQALGLEVRSVLAIGGIGGLAIGLAGREICENLLNGFLLMTTVSVDAD